MLANNRESKRMAWGSFGGRSRVVVPHCNSVQGRPTRGKNDAVQVIVNGRDDHLIVSQDTSDCVCLSETASRSDCASADPCSGFEPINAVNLCAIASCRDAQRFETSVQQRRKHSANRQPSITGRFSRLYDVKVFRAVNRIHGCQKAEERGVCGHDLVYQSRNI